MRKTILFLVLAAAFFGSKAQAQTKQPKTVREFFSLLPQKYFLLEGCLPRTDRNCEKARRQYVEAFLEVEDTPNGYWKSGCDGAQTCLEMALFKRPDNTYIVGLRTFAEAQNEHYFLEYRNGAWLDVSSKVIPQFSRKNMYELPRRGTTVKVFAKKIIEKGSDYEVTEKGRKLYDLVWSDGRFTIKK